MFTPKVFDLSGYCIIINIVIFFLRNNIVMPIQPLVFIHCTMMSFVHIFPGDFRSPRQSPNE